MPDSRASIDAMMLIELFVPKDALDLAERRRLAERLLTEFMTEAEHSAAPAEVLAANQALEQVLVHEIDPWIVGGHTREAGEPPCYVVRITLPGPWRKEMSETAIERVTRVIAGGAAEADDPDRVYRESVVWVQLIGIAEGSGGTYGKVMRSADIVDEITKPFRESPDRQRLIAEAAANGLGIDPICGMSVPLAEAEITLEHDGTTYAFCCVGCRQVFLSEVNA